MCVCVFYSLPLSMHFVYFNFLMILSNYFIYLFLIDFNFDTFLEKCQIPHRNKLI